MKGYLAIAALAGAAIATPMPQVATPAGCQTSVAGSFGISVVNVTKSAKRDLETRQGPDGALTITLQNGVLKDANGRTGNIVANHQFQFDNPIQAGALITSGWSVCSNGSLALTSAIFYQCLSGSFYNLYDQSQGGQCNPVYIVTTVGSASAGPAPAPAPSGSVSQLPDGQAQATTAQTVSQITDGQIQASTGTAKVTQITDGQIQAPTGKVSQITDGQIQAPTGTSAKVTQITDGQIQAPTGKVSQITDGQIQAPTGTSARVTQITDGQIQAPTGQVSQINDGQIQAPTGTPAIATYVGAAPRELAGSFAFVAGIVGAIAML